MVRKERANDKQVGGNHYQSEYQHWDWIIDLKVGYLEGNATKYLSRWRKKNGVTDLCKALHYVKKLIETAEFDEACLEEVDRYQKPCNRINVMDFTRTLQFCEDNKLTPDECMCFIILSCWSSPIELRRCFEIIENIINKEQHASEEKLQSE